MDIKLLFQAISKYILGLLLVFGLVFIPAGSFSFWNGWLFIGLLFIPMFIVGIILFIKNPTLLKSRLDAKEKENDQKMVVLISGIMFLTGFIIAGLNYRFNWIILPNIVIIISSALFVISYIIYGEVLRENSYLLRNIEVKEGQKVVDTGLYSIIRHPMYAATIILFLTIPLILGSIISFIIFLIYPVVIMKRIKNEEEVLERELVGYKEYKKKVKYRLLPYVW